MEVERGEKGKGVNDFGFSILDCGLWLEEIENPKSLNPQTLPDPKEYYYAGNNKSICL
ncbi:MAG: hypothetical protein QME42_06390 [bacterium]|nr:hypothetical protein [bacterium]